MPPMRRAAAVLAKAFPGREIVPVPCRPLIWQNGSLHCITHAACREGRAFVHRASDTLRRTSPARRPDPGAQPRQHADANLAVIEARVAEAAAAGAQLVLLQELHNGAVLLPARMRSTSSTCAEPIPGPSTERLGALAKQHGVVLVSSLFERRAAGLYHNTAVVFEADGRLAGKYRKMHIPDDPGFYEKFYFTPGDLGFEPIDTSVGRLGVLVCWDQWYPEGRAPDGAGRCGTAALPDRDRLGSRTTSRPRRIASATPGSSATAATPSPTACRC